MKIRLNGQNLEDAIKAESGSRSPKHNSADNCAEKSTYEAEPIYVNDSETRAPACLLPDDNPIFRNGQYYRLYYSEDIKAVCKGDESCLIEESPDRISTPQTNVSSIPYFWRIDTVLASGEVLEGRIWST